MSWPAACASGPSWPQPVMRPNTSRGLRASTTSGPRPSRSITPGRKPSISASALASKSSTCAIAALSFRSSSTTLRPRTATAFKFFLAPTRSSVTTSAPMSASIMQANGPGPMPANSTTRKPASGPEARVEVFGADLSSTCLSIAEISGSCGLAAVAGGIAKRYFSRVGPQFGILLLPFSAGALFGDLAAERDVDRDFPVAHRRHRLLARHRLLDEGCEFLLLFLFALDLAHPKLRHHFLCE